MHISAYAYIYIVIMVNLTTIRNHVVIMLNGGLSSALTYHNVNHTLDVTLQCLAIAGEEGITDKQILLELQIAALYHDTGFMFTYLKHEERSCKIARQQLPGFGIDKKVIENICDLIMATKVPQEPGNNHQKIICDADLDYLGREDFFETGHKLRLELIAHKLISGENDWEDRQLNFLQTHRYFTKTSRQKRGPVKMKFMKQLLNHKINKRPNYY
ncbi:MAG: HD domain-containing protein [Ferruginibacter sp.]